MEIEAYLSARDAQCEPLLRSIQEHSVPGDVRALREYGLTLAVSADAAKEDLSRRVDGTKEISIADHAEIVRLAQRIDAAYLVAAVCEEYADFAGRCLRCRP